MVETRRPARATVGAVLTATVQALAVAGLGLLAAGASVAGGGASAAPAPRVVTIRADTIEVDAAGQVATATRVSISDGRTTATAARATLYHASGRGVLSGDAKVEAPQGVLEGREITVTYTRTSITRIVAQGQASLETAEALISAPQVALDPATEVVTGRGGVRVFVPPDVVATGVVLSYDRRRDVLLLRGGVRVQNPEGFVTGDRLDAGRRLEHAVVVGAVHARFRDLDVRSRRGELFGREKRAVFDGDVRVAHPGRQLTADRVTVWYDTRRVVAEGQTWMRVEPEP